MSDPLITHLAGNWQIYGLLVLCGGVTANVKTLKANVTKLWEQKQDINVCDSEHKHVSESLVRIESKVDQLLGGGGK